MKNENQEITIIGKANFVNFDKFIEWCGTEDAEEFFSVKNLWTSTLYDLQGEIPGVNVSQLFDKTKKQQYTKEEKRSFIEPLARYRDYIESFSSPDCPLAFDLIYEHEKFDIIAFGNSQFLIPSGFIEKTPYKDYSATPIGRLYDQISGSTGSDFEAKLIPANTRNSNVSIIERQTSIEDNARQMTVIMGEIDDVNNARTGELAELQAEIDRQMKILQDKKDKLLEELNIKKQEMEQKKQQLEFELFLLESEIYSIRCFLGEVVDFIKIRSGMLPLNLRFTYSRKSDSWTKSSERL